MEEKSSRVGEIQHDKKDETEPGHDLLPHEALLSPLYQEYL